MRQISFHPVDVDLYDGLIDPLVAGEKVNPEEFITRAARMREVVWRTQRYKTALARLLEELEPPPPPTEGRVWGRVKARLERFDFRPPRAARLAGAVVEPEIHLEGRPFLVTEGSAEAVVTLVTEFAAAEGDSTLDGLIVEQLVRLSPELAREVRPADIEPLSAPAAHRREVLDELRSLFELCGAAREGRTWESEDGTRRPAVETLVAELPVRSARIHSRALPFWIARDLDGLETVCRAAEVEPPDCLIPARRLLARAVDEFPDLADSMGVELGPNPGVGAFVPPSDIEELLDFLGRQGSRIIQVATRCGEGAACSALLRKIRECARYAERHGLGYLEVSSIPVPRWEPCLDPVLV